MIEGDIRREMTVDTGQKYQEKFEAASKMLCQLKQIDRLNKWNDYMDIPAVEEVLHVSSYPLLESMVLALIFLMELQKWGKPLFWKVFSASIYAPKICWSMSTQTQIMGILLQYHILF